MSRTFCQTMDVICKTKKAIYLRLPLAMQADCGGCSCDECKADPSIGEMGRAVQKCGLAKNAHTAHMPRVGGAIQGTHAAQGAANRLNSPDDGLWGQAETPRGVGRYPK